MPVPKVANNGFKSVLCSTIMDLFDEHVLAVLSDGQAKTRLYGKSITKSHQIKLLV